MAHMRFLQPAGLALDRAKNRWLDVQSGPVWSAHVRRKSALADATDLVLTVCELAGTDELVGSQDPRLQLAIQDKDTPYIFEHLIRSFSLQGVSDRAAWTFMENHDQPTWLDLVRATGQAPACSKLRGYWTFERCGYRKAESTCTELAALPNCPLPAMIYATGA